MAQADSDMPDSLLPPCIGAGEEGSLFSVLKPPAPPAPHPSFTPQPAPAQQELSESVKALSRKMEEFQKKLEETPLPVPQLKNDPAQVELVAFLQARIGVLEQKIIEAQQGALAAQLKLTEREGVERRIRAETEEVLNTARENGRALELQRVLADRIAKLERGENELGQRLSSLTAAIDKKISQAGAAETAVVRSEVDAILPELKELRKKMLRIEDWRQKAGGWDKIFEEVAMLSSKLAIVQMAFSRVEEMEVKVKAMAGFDEMVRVMLNRFSQAEEQFKSLSSAFGVAEARNQMDRDSVFNLKAGMSDMCSRVGALAASLKAVSEDLGALKDKQAQMDKFVNGQAESILALERQRKDIAENMKEHLGKIRDIVDRFGGCSK